MRVVYCVPEGSSLLEMFVLQVRDLEDINYTNDLLVEGAKEQELELREDIDLTTAKLREVSTRHSEQGIEPQGTAATRSGHWAQLVLLVYLFAFTMVIMFFIA